MKQYKRSQFCIFTATKWEASFLQDSLRSFSTGSDETFEANFPACSVSLHVTGIGPVKAFSNTKSVLQRLDVDEVLLFGICGSLSPKISIGERIVSDIVVSWERDKCSEVVKSPKGLLRERVCSLPDGLTFECLRPIVSVESFVDRSAVRDQLREETDCDVVDMESGSIAKYSSAVGLPWLVAKVVSDCADKACQSTPLEARRELIRLARDLAKLLQRF